jgi:hypothetical protein
MTKNMAAMAGAPIAETIRIQGFLAKLDVIA